MDAMPEVHDLELPERYREELPRSWQPWLEQLPELVATYLERWELTVAGELPLCHSYVVAVDRADGRACVLKIQPTDVPEIAGAERELLGLRLGAPIAVRVVDQDATRGVLLLERALPGTALDELAGQDDDVVTETLATVIRDYGRPLDDPGSLGLRPLEEYAEAFERFDRGSYGRIGRGAPRMDELGSALPAMRSARDTAERVLSELLVDHSAPYLLHGDLHHGNVLADDERGLVVVDPWGLYGDRSADVAPALHNPLEYVARTTDVHALVRRRIAIYAEVLDIDKEHLTAWCYVYNVIRALWTVEDGGEASENDAGVRTVLALRQLI